ncbi:ABC transporter permease [Phycicoccus sp. BSK3Z-2]|uniref:ABC transporter permease n=1 Tax=Phycicoccus avicenniae TaxID=2828860 RepID=A0A941D571_9MICO|nr:ABC transporter permease [Phycicoccus avicenniae]MBR7742319.1 ABC transporter permease [Phycicoccus avicenniae]
MTTVDTPVTAATAATATRAPSTLALLGAEVRDELKQVYREPAALFFSVLMPVAFFAFFSAMFGGETAGVGGLPVGTTMLATFGAYGVLGATMLTPGIGLAEERERGWLDVVKVSPVPVPLTLLAKVVATLPYCVGILGAMTATAAALGVLRIGVGQWLLLLAALLVGSLPFALIGLAVGARASGNATTAVLNAFVIPMAIAGGLWFPLEMLPGWMGSVAQFLPTYHLSRLALGPLEGGAATGSIGHAAYLLGFAVVAGAVAAVAYRRPAR